MAGRALRHRRIYRLSDPLSGGDRPRRAHGGSVPALRRAAGGSGSDGREQECRMPTLHDSDGGAGGYQDQSHQRSMNWPTGSPGCSPGSRNTSISAVPARYRGAGRHVYPGFLQLSAFVSMNMGRHCPRSISTCTAIWSGAMTSQGRRQASKFYDEYLAVSDLPAEFYLETVQKVFQEHHLAPAASFSIMAARPLVPPRFRRRPHCLRWKARRDDICSVGQDRGGSMT